MKNTLIDKKGLLFSYDRVRVEILQILSIFFAIFVFLGLLMIPLHSYRFIYIVVPLTYFCIIGIVSYEVWGVYVVHMEGPASYKEPVNQLPVVVSSPPPTFFRKVNDGIADY
jgi:hypothetical protein